MRSCSPQASLDTRSLISVVSQDDDKENQTTQQSQTFCVSRPKSALSQSFHSVKVKKPRAIPRQRARSSMKTETIAVTTAST
jgi:hypothetical protein